MSEATARESKAPTESEIAGSKAAAPVHPVLKGVHHTAKPTWKLRETVEFYRDKLGLPIVHAISARGWGPSNHPDFLHFFFNSGKGSTIAFFYYIGADQPEYTKPLEDYRSRASHTAWQVDSLDELLEWRTRLEQQGIALRYQIRHELIESIYFADPNGYPIEITYEVRPMNRLDSRDAEETLEAAMQREDAEKQQGERFVSVDQVWRGKASNRARSAPLGAGSGKDGDDIAGGEAVLYILDVPEFEPLVKAAKASDAYRLTGPDNGYWRVSSKEALVFERKALGFVPALWNGALTGGYAGEIEAFNRDRLEIRPAGSKP